MSPAQRARSYDIPVAAGVLAASAEIYAAGLGVKVEDIGDVWVRAMANPIEPVLVENAPCQEVVITGDALSAPGGGLAALAGADIDARLRLRALSDGDLMRHP